MEISWWFTWKHKTVCDISTRGIKDDLKYHKKDPWANQQSSRGWHKDSSSHSICLSYEEIFVSAPDTDVFLIILSMILDMNIKLYMLTGTGSKRCIIDMNAVGDDIFDNQNQTNNSKNDLLKSLISLGSIVSRAVIHLVHCQE